MAESPENSTPSSKGDEPPWERMLRRQTNVRITEAAREVLDLTAERLAGEGRKPNPGRVVDCLLRSFTVDELVDIVQRRAEHDELARAAWSRSGT